MLTHYLQIAREMCRPCLDDEMNKGFVECLKHEVHESVHENAYLHTRR